MMMRRWLLVVAWRPWGTLGLQTQSHVAGRRVETRPVRCLYMPDPGPTTKKKKKKTEPPNLRSTGKSMMTFSDDDDDEKTEEEEEEESASAVVERALAKAMESERRKQASLEKEEKEAAKAEALGRWAELVTANLWRMDDETRRVEVEDWDTGEMKVLEFVKPPKDEAEEAFKKCRRMKRGSTAVATLLEKSRARSEKLRRALEEVDPEVKLEAATRLKVQIQRTPKPVVEPKKKKWTGREFEAPISKVPILVGRNRRENDYLSLVLARDGDLWLHARGNAGAHVLLQLSVLPKNKRQPSDDDLIAAANAAAYYSDAKEDSKVAVTVALPRHVIKPPKAPPGAVTLREEHAVFFARPHLHHPLHLQHLQDQEVSSSPRRRRDLNKAKNKKRRA